MLRRLLFVAVFLLLASCGSTTPPVSVGTIDPAVKISDLRPGDAVVIGQQNGSSLSIRFNMERGREDMQQLQIHSTPSVGQSDDDVVELCSDCTTNVSLAQGALVMVKDGVISLDLDSTWYIAQALQVKSNLVLWPSDGNWSVIHAPEGDYWFRELSRESATADSYRVTFQVIMPGDPEPQQFTTPNSKFSNHAIQPLDKYIVAPADWPFEENITMP
jgi:hypothetical protein